MVFKQCFNSVLRLLNYYSRCQLNIGKGNAPEGTMPILDLLPTIQPFAVSYPYNHPTRTIVGSEMLLFKPKKNLLF